MRSERLLRETPVIWRRLVLLAAWGLLACSGPALAAEELPARALAEQLLTSEGVRAGLCVHVGCGDGRLTAELSLGGKFLVHGLSADRDEVEKARRHIQAKGTYGQVSVDVSSLERLPYASNMVNVIVVDRASTLLKEGLSIKEIVRVLCPRGVAFLGGVGSGALDQDALKARLTEAGAEDFEILRRNGLWARITKPWPAEMDEWPQYRHDPSLKLPYQDIG